MEASGSMDLADNAIVRATQVFVKRQPEIHLFAARFREQHDDIPGARAAYQLVHSEISPGLLEATIKHANMEQRLGNHDDACSLYEQAIAIEKAKEQSQTLPLLFAQYARFLYLVSGKGDKAKEVLDQAVENAHLSKPLLEAIIHLESIQPQPKRIEYLDSLIEKFIVPTIDASFTASMDEREELSSIYMEFLDLFGDAKSIKKADDRHAKLFLQNRTSLLESKKRRSDDYLVSDKAKLAKAVTPVTASAMAPYPVGVQNQWPAGYGIQPQSWPQTTQAQVQQWNPAYGQQAAAYNAYGTYGSNYGAAAQVPPALPQAAPYGAYPSTYPAPNYGQPGVAATLTPSVPQQPSPAPVPPAAAATTAYYGSYY
ncbi:unnamed protein product [Cuscuta campestris]|uniref:Suppressor of forked domain-containing protein n=1 Tax=Cuscuta campestris TaxID=132261 RepID=A0A484MC46_9ASTE|nr:unnamed protein product [Cuscuta campestris]